VIFLIRGPNFSSGSELCIPYIYLYENATSYLSEGSPGAQFGRCFAPVLESGFLPSYTLYKEARARSETGKETIFFIRSEPRAGG
jgi:hypothetical protein